jgi:hypothetical protein
MTSPFFSRIPQGFLIALLMNAPIVYAHHTFRADAGRPVTLRGPITKIE